MADACAMFSNSGNPILWLSVLGLSGTRSLWKEIEGEIECVCVCVCVRERVSVFLY